MPLRPTVLFLLVVAVSHAAEIRGKVTNAEGGEPLGRVQVTVLETKSSTATAGDGTFVIHDLAPGNYTLRLNAVSYRLLSTTFTLTAPDEVKEFSITMVPDNFRRTDKVEVRGDVFQGADSPAVSETNLTSSEIKEASTVFANDPFRAVQALPGVSASGNNELLAEFSVMGAPFDQVGVYVDDVLLPRPFHAVPSVSNAASLSLLSSETVEDLKLMPVAYPEKFGDNTGAALSAQTRDGSRTARPLFRVAAGMADSEFLGEGALDRAKRGSWLATARKSYLGYIVRSRVGPDFSDVSFYDASLKLTYDIKPNHNLSFYGLGGHTNVNGTGATTDPSEVRQGSGDFTFLRVGWKWGITPHLVLDNRAAYIRQPFDQRNFQAQPLSNSAYYEWVGGSNLAWSWRKDAVLEAGWTLRRLGESLDVFIPGAPTNPFVASRQTVLRNSSYVQNASSLVKGRVHVIAGLRWDARQDFHAHPVSPQVAIAVQALPATQLQFGFGRYHAIGFPDGRFSVSPNPCVSTAQGLSRSNHYTAAVEQRFGENTRLRLEAFDRQNEALARYDTPSPCVQPFPTGAFFTSTRDYTRGFQLIFQRRSANRLSGWIGYTLLKARESFLFPSPNGTSLGFTPYFDSFEDQRHTVNAFGTYRVTPSINVSGKILYGSGFPFDFGFIVGPGGPQAVPVHRFGPYQRLDLRFDKAWAFKHWKLTLYTEVLNVTDHKNGIFNGTTEVNGHVTVHLQQTLPVTPTAGLVFEF